MKITIKKATVLVLRVLSPKVKGRSVNIPVRIRTTYPEHTAPDSNTIAGHQRSELQKINDRWIADAKEHITLIQSQFVKN